MRGRIHLVLLVAVLASGFRALAQTPAPTPAPAPVTLLAPGNTEPSTQRFMKLVAFELTRRGQALVTENEAAALLGRPLSAALVDCSGDDLCYLALGQVVHATQVLIGTAAVSPKDPAKYECVFRIVESRSGKTRGPMQVTVSGTETGLGIAANTVAENLAPRPRLTVVATPTPVAPLPTPVPAATPAPTPVSIAVGTAEPTPTPGTEGMDAVQPPPPTVRGPRPPLSRDPAFWSIAGAGLLVLGVGAFFGASALQQDEPEEKGSSTVQVRF